MEVMHERNAHNFPLDLAAGEVAPVAQYFSVKSNNLSFGLGKG
jgi:hypothetical protein